MAANIAFGDDFFDSIFNDAGDLDSIFKEEPKKEEAKQEPAKEEASPSNEPANEAEAPKAEEKTEEPATETEVPAEEPKAEEAHSEEEATKNILEAEAPKEEAPAKEEPKAGAAEEVKEEVEAVAAEPDDTKDDADAEATVAPEENVEADAPAGVEAEAAEPAEPVVEVTVAKPKRRRSKKAAKAADEKKAEKETEKAEAKTETPKTAEEAPVVAAAAPINEDILQGLTLVLGPKYEAFKKDVKERIAKINVKPGMAPGVISTMISLNNEVDGLLSFVGEDYFSMYTRIADSKTGLIEVTRKMAELNTKGTAGDKKRAGELAVMNYVWPATGEKINLLEYANALKQATNFISSARAYTKSTSIALTMMSKLSA